MTDLQVTPSTSYAPSVRSRTGLEPGMSLLYLTLLNPDTQTTSALVKWTEWWHEMCARKSVSGVLQLGDSDSDYILVCTPVDDLD